MSDVSYAGEGGASRWVEASLRGMQQIAAEDDAARERLARQCKKQETLEVAATFAELGKLGGNARAQSFRNGTVDLWSDKTCDCGCGRRLSKQNRSGYATPCRDAHKRIKLPKIFCRCGSEIRDRSETRCSRCREGRRREREAA